MRSLALVLAIVAGQQPDSLTDAQKRVDAAAKKLVDARATTAQLVAALEAAQAGVVAANRELNDATTTLIKVQSNLRDGQLDAEQRAIEAIKSLIHPGAPPVKPIKQKPKKGIFDTKANERSPNSLASLAEIIAANEKELAKAEKKFTPKGGPVELAARTIDKDMRWYAGDDGWRFLWLGDEMVVSAPTDSAKVEDMQFKINKEWWKYSDLKDGPGEANGWKRRYANNAVIMSRRGNDAQVMLNGKWYWVPEAK